MTNEATTPDVSIRNEGSVFLFELISPTAKVWVEDHVSGDNTFYAGFLVVEQHYARDLAQAMIANGLDVQCDMIL